MKCSFIAFFSTILITLLGCSKPESIRIQDIFNGQNFRQFMFDRNYIPSDYELSIIHYILRHTSENNIHKMRGESRNEVYINEDRDEHGYSEAVYDEYGQLVTNSYNQASFNFYLYKTEPIKHFGYDILPWLDMGNTRDDPTSFVERLHYYTLDLNIGIQTYIFNGSVSDFKEIEYSDLPRNEQLIYQFFCYVLFSKDYAVRLDNESKERLKQNTDLYWKYFGQTQSKLGVDNFR